MNEEIKQQLNDLRKRLSIDPFDLENECVNQPALYAEVGELATEAKSVAKVAKDTLEYTRSDLSFRIRKDPGKYGVEKVTEASVEAAIVIQKDYQDASNNLIETQRVADAFCILQTSLEQRKSMIKDLVTLFVYSYYSTRNQGMNNEKSEMGEVTREQIVKRRMELAEQRGRRSEEVEEEVE